MASDADGTDRAGLGFASIEWSLRDLELDDVGRALTDGATDVIASEEWQVRFAENASRVVMLLERHLQDRVAALEAETAAADGATTARLAELKEARGKADREEKDRLRPVNPAVQPGVYQAVMRVSARGESSIGVRGVLLRLAGAPGATPLAEAISDENGNAVLAVPEDRLQQGDDAMLMAVPAGAGEARPVILQRSVRIRPSQVDLFRGEIHADQGFEVEVEAATRAAEGRDALRESLAQRHEQVSTTAGARRTELQAEITQFKALLAGEAAGSAQPVAPARRPVQAARPAPKRPQKTGRTSKPRKRPSR